MLVNLDIYSGSFSCGGLRDHAPSENPRGKASSQIVCDVFKLQGCEDYRSCVRLAVILVLIIFLQLCPDGVSRSRLMSHEWSF